METARIHQTLTRVELARLLYAIWLPSLRNPMFDNDAPIGKFLHALEAALVRAGEPDPPPFPWFADIGGREALAIVRGSSPGAIGDAPVPGWIKAHSLFLLDYTQRSLAEEEKQHALESKAAGSGAN